MKYSLILLALLFSSILSNAQSPVASKHNLMISPKAIEHLQTENLKTSCIAKNINKLENNKKETADRYCCCWVAQSCGGMGCLVCGCPYCPLDKVPDSSKSNNQLRSLELKDWLR